MSSNKRSAELPATEPYFTRSKAPLFQGKLTEHFDNALRKIRDLPSKIARTENTMALETPEDSLLKTNQKVDDSPANKTAQKGGAAAQAASALMDLAEGGAVGGQTQKQGGAASSKKYTQTRKPAFEFSAQKSVTEAIPSWNGGQTKDHC